MSDIRPSPATILETIRACLDNGQRLLDESYDLEFRTPSSTRYFLAMIAQEEMAKAFMLFLIKEEVFPFTSPIRRAINDHICKQLVGMIMDYMIMHWDDISELDAMIERDFDLGHRMPDDIGSAMELLRYEKIGRWESNRWVWDQDPNYDKSALSIAEGKKDRRKQDSLYVRIARDGRVSSTPHVITEAETGEAIEHAGRYKRFVESLLQGDASSHRYDKAMAALKALFSSGRQSPA